MTAPTWLTKRLQIDPHTYPVFDAPKRSTGITLDLNESYWFWNDDLYTQLQQRVDKNAIGHYPDYTELYEALAAYTGMPVAHLCVTNGSDQSIGFLMSVLAQSGGTAVIPGPTFTIYPHIAHRASIHSVFVPHTITNGTYVFPLQDTLEALRTATDPTLFLCTPNNPLGTPIPIDDMCILLQYTYDNGIPTVIDEAYYEYGTTTYAPMVRDHDTLIVLRSFSKGFGMPGLRLGYTIAHPSIIHLIKSAKLPWNVNQVAAHAGIIALAHQEYFAQKRDEVHTERSHLTQALRDISIEPLDSVCNFVTAPTTHADALVRSLAQQGVYIKNVSGYAYGGEPLQHAVRIAVPAPHDRSAVHDALLHAHAQYGTVS